MEEEVKILNKIIVEAILEGADPGGTYRNNTENLVKAMYTWMYFKNASKKYEVCETAEVPLTDGSYLPCPQFEKIFNKSEAIAEWHRIENQLKEKLTADSMLN